jgi:drug/metabolite transporter (DMT)-like permease
MSADSLVKAQHKPLPAFALMGGAILCFCLVDATAKWMTAGYDPWQIVLISRVIPLSIALFLAYRQTGNPLDFRTKFPREQAIRVLLSVPMIWCFFIGLKSMSLAEAITIAFGAPLFIVMLSRPLLNEKIGPRRWTAVAIGFLGVLIALRPGFGGSLTGHLLVLLSAFCYALSMVLTRRFSGREPTHNIYFYGAIGSVVVGSFMAAPVWVAPDAIDWGLLLLVGFWGAVGGYAVIRAYRLGEASMLAPIEYTALIWSILFDLILFKSTPMLSVLLGAAIIIGANLYVAHREHQLRKTVAAE